MLSSRRSFVSAAVALAALGRPRGASAQPAALRIACDPVGAYAEALYANDAGFFRKAGLDVELLVLGTGAAIVDAVAGGAADIGISNPIPIANAVLHGVRFQYICNGAMSVPGTTDVCVAADGPVTGAKDLDGKVIGSSGLKNITAAALYAWIDQNGGDASSVHLIELPFPAMAAAVRRGTVAAAAIPEPLLGTALAAGGIRTVLPHLFDVFGPSFMIGGWFAKTDWIAANLPLVRRYVATIYETARWANVQLDAAAAILAKYSKQDVAIIRASVHTPYGTALRPAMFQRVLDLGARYHVIERPLNAADLIASL